MWRSRVAPVLSKLVRNLVTAYHTRLFPLHREDMTGEVAEWSNAPDSKSGLRFRRNVGSNPTLSAKVAAGCGRSAATEEFNV